MLRKGKGLECAGMENTQRLARHPANGEPAEMPAKEPEMVGEGDDVTARVLISMGVGGAIPMATLVKPLTRYRSVNAGICGSHMDRFVARELQTQRECRFPVHQSDSSVQYRLLLPCRWSCQVSLFWSLLDICFTNLQ